VVWGGRPRPPLLTFRWRHDTHPTCEAPEAVLFPGWKSKSRAAGGGARPTQAQLNLFSILWHDV